MNKNVSVYFDLVRILAALCVVLGHLTQLTDSFLWHFGGLGHEAVIVFFVLSGFVIAYTAETKDRILAIYATNRLARLYSVLLPCLVLTPLFDMAGQSFSAGQYDIAGDSEATIKAVFQSTFFLNQVWFANLQYFSNGPLWSLSYEFWYYVIFGAAFFLTGYARAIAVVISCLIAGPKILILMPIWLMGVAAYHYCCRGITPREGAVWTLLSIAGFFVFFKTGLGGMLNDVSQSIADRNKPLFGDFSDQFLADSVLGMMLTANFIGISGLATRLNLNGLEPAVRAASGFTFSIYLFHAPLLHFLNAAIPTQISTGIRAVAILAATIGGCCLLGYWTERKKAVYVDSFRKLSRSVLRNRYRTTGE